ncbi:MAG: alpha/beta fold hydrolase [Chitinophagaceae bacterium]|nr:alpha/beta fold hydrolase [Chitinophagaceae bacterium]
MKKLLILALIVSSIRLSAQSDLVWTKDSPAGMVELQINSAGSLLQGFMYKANGSKPHPTLLLLHGYPGNERNLDLAQAVRAHGWNVIYFNYRGSWGSQGEFSFRHCVEDVRNLITWCGQNAARLQIDMNNIALFGHSMGGFVCLKALAENPGIKKGFALSAWNLYADASNKSKNGKLNELEKEADGYFVLNKRSGKDLFAPVLADPGYHNLVNTARGLSGKQLIMLDEHHENAALARTIQQANRAYFSYQVWDTDHPFTNKRASLIRTVIAFLDKP